MPKVLAPVCGRPFIEHVLGLLAARGFERVLLCIGYGGDAIIDAVADGSRFGLTIGYSSDGPQPIGTAAALRRAFAGSAGWFWILNGDTYLDVDYGEIESYHRRRCPDAPLVVVYKNDNRFWPSNIVLRDETVAIYDKEGRAGPMDHIDAGAAILSAAVFERYPAVRDLPQLYALLARSSKLSAYVSPNRFFEINTPRSLAETAGFLGDACPSVQSRSLGTWR
jgi:NDP-sugar pyrophosphorylase family protein